MITCSMPAATASSTAYWMTGLSTSGSISLGCAFVAGRKRVPQPAAGKTAFRTRKTDLVERVNRSVEDSIAPITGPSVTAPRAWNSAGSGGDRASEATDRGAERGRLVEVGEVRRAADQDAPRVDGGRR